MSRLNITNRLPYLIHFVDLDEMVEEMLDCWKEEDEVSPVRVCTLTSREDTEAGFRTSTTYIAVRQIKRYPAQSILSWAWPVGEVTSIPQGEFPEKSTIDDIAEMARTMETAVIKHLESAGNNPERMLPALDVRRGVIDIDEREPLFGVWRKWEEENYEDIG